MKTCKFLFELRSCSIYLERIPTASMLIRVYKAPRMGDGTVLGLDNVEPEKWGESDVLI